MNRALCIHRGSLPEIIEQHVAVELRWNVVQLDIFVRVVYGVDPYLADAEIFFRTYGDTVNPYVTPLFYQRVRQEQHQYVFHKVSRVRLQNLHGQIAHLFVLVVVPLRKNVVAHKEEHTQRQPLFENLHHGPKSDHTVVLNQLLVALSIPA